MDVDPSRLTERADVLEQPAHITTNVSSATNVRKTTLTLAMMDGLVDRPHFPRRSPDGRRGSLRRVCAHPSPAQLEDFEPKRARNTSTNAEKKITGV
jgi:hypothetical protein